MIREDVAYVTVHTDVATGVMAALSNEVDSSDNGTSIDGEKPKKKRKRKREREKRRGLALLSSTSLTAQLI